MDTVTFIGGLVLLAISVLSVYRPNWVWGQPRAAPQNPEQWRRMQHRRMVGTVVYFALGATLLILSLK
ncbi:MAG: hypothetical protein ACUVXG_04785 [Anaerolineae bacterium]